MPAPYNVAVIVGSLRKESFNRKMARAAIGRSRPRRSRSTSSRSARLPLYNEDLEAEAPPGGVDRVSRRGSAAADAVLFVTPEYNRSVPGVLKNAIDVGSRPYGKSVWSGKPGRGRQRVAGRHRRLRRQPPPAPVVRVPRHAGDAAAGGLYRRRRQALRRRAGR